MTTAAPSIATHAQRAAINQAATRALTDLGLSDYTGAQYLSINPGVAAFRTAPADGAVCVTLTPAVPPGTLARARQALADIGAPVLPVGHLEGFPRFLLFAPALHHPGELRTVSVTWWISAQDTGMPARGLRHDDVTLCAHQDPVQHTDESHVPAILAAHHSVPIDHVRVFTVTP